MASARYQRGHGQDFTAKTGASKLGQAAYKSQSDPNVGRPVVNKDYSDAAGFKVYLEGRDSRKGGRGRRVK